MGAIRDFFFGGIDDINSLGNQTEIRHGSHDSMGGESPLLQGYIPIQRSEVTPLTPESALSLSSVYAAVNIIVNAMQQLEIGVYRWNKELAPEEYAKGVFSVRRPDAFSNRAKFIKQTVMSMATHGNAYWKVQRADRNNPISLAQNLTVLNPLSVSVQYDKNGVRSYAYFDGRNTTVLRDHEVKHLKLTEVWGHDYGFGPIQAARAELIAMRQTTEYAQNAFTEYPSGIVSTDDYLDEDMAKAYKERWYTDATTGQRIRFMGNGMKYTPFMFTPQDAQFVETRNMDVTTVARMFHVPAPYLMADAGNSMTYQNMLDVDKEFFKYGLSAYFVEIEEALSDLLPNGQTAKFKTEGFLRADEAQRATVNKAYIDMGVRTQEEVRLAEGYGPMPDELKARNNKPAVVEAPAPVEKEEDNE